MGSRGFVAGCRSGCTVIHQQGLDSWLKQSEGVFQLFYDCKLTLLQTHLSSMCSNGWWCGRHRQCLTVSATIVQIVTCSFFQWKKEKRQKSQFTPPNSVQQNQFEVGLKNEIWWVVVQWLTENTLDTQKDICAHTYTHTQNKLTYSKQQRKS